MEKIILLETTITIAIVALLILYTRRLKKKLKKHILRHHKMQKYFREK